MKSIVLIFIVLQFVSCKQIVKSDVEEALEDTNDESISEANFLKVEVDSLYTLSIPKYMKVMNNLRNQASLQYGNAYKDVYTVVVSDDKQDFIDYLKEIGAYKENLSVLANYSQVKVKYLKEEIANVKVMTYRLEKLKNYKASQYKFISEIDNTNIVYIIAFIETKGDLFMIMNWTKEDCLPRFENTFGIIIDSFEYLLNTKNTNEIQ